MTSIPDPTTRKVWLVHAFPGPGKGFAFSLSDRTGKEPRLVQAEEDLKIKDTRREAVRAVFGPKSFALNVGRALCSSLAKKES